MKLLGLSPGRIFSGFETSFFDATRAQGASVDHIEVEIPWLKWACTLTSFHPRLKTWATRRDVHYHTSITAFKQKSSFARRAVESHQDSVDAIYQVGALWNPTGHDIRIPLILHVDYTSLLSKRRKSEWRRKTKRLEDFWIHEEKILYESAAVILTTTENARRSIIMNYGIAPDHVVTVGAGVSPPYNQLEPDRFPAYDSRKLFFVGKGFQGKGLDTILEAIPIVRQTIPDATLTVVGPTNAAIDVDGVEYLGRIADRSRVRDLYYEHAAFVMPSRFEPLGQVFLEAMSCQLACIGSNVDAMPELISDGKTGYVIECGDHRKLAEHIIELLGNPDLAQRMGRAGFKRLRQHFTWEEVGRKIYQTIERHL